MKKILLLAAMVVMVITAGAQSRPQAYSGQTNDSRLKQQSMVKKSFQAEAPRKDLTTRSYAPVGKRLSIDASKLTPVTRANRTSQVMQPGQQLQNKVLDKILSKGMPSDRRMVNFQPTITLDEQTTANARAARKAPTFSNSYTAFARAYSTNEVEQWTMTPKTVTIKDEADNEKEVDALVDVIPTPESLRQLYPNGVPIKYTIEDGIITIQPQTVGKYQNEAKDTTFYVTLFSPTSDDFDGVINMTLGEDGKLKVTNGSWICFGVYANVMFEPFDEEEGAPESFLHAYEIYANVTYHYGYGVTVDQEYNAHGTDYFANVPVDWKMERCSMNMDGEATPFFRNLVPNPFDNLFADGIEVDYEQEGNTITVKPQVIASGTDDDGSKFYVMLFSGRDDNGIIVFTMGEDGSLTTVENEAIYIGYWKTEKFDPTYETYDGGALIIDKPKYRLPNAAPEAPEEVFFESNELVLFAGYGVTSGYSYNSNLGVMGAYTPVSFRNNTFDIATNFEWTVTENEGDEDEAVFTGTDRDFGFNTKGGAVYSNFSLTAYNEGTKSDPYTWGAGVSFVEDNDGKDTEEIRYEDVYYYGGRGQSSFRFTDGTYATMTRQNPDLNLTFYVNFGTPDITAQYDASDISTIYSYQGKPSTPLFLTGVTLPTVSFEFNDEENFNLHIKLCKCTRTSAGRLELGDVIAEGDATKDNVESFETGVTTISFDKLYIEDEAGMSEELNYLFIEDEFVIVIEGWDNGTFSGVLGSQKFDDNSVTSTWFQSPGEERLRSYSNGWPTLFIGLDNATYGYLHTEDNTDLQFAAAGGEQSMHVNPMYYDIDDDTQEPTYLLDIESITVTVDGKEMVMEEIPEWLSIGIANEDYTTATEKDEDGEEYEYFVNGIDYDLVISVDALPEGTKSRSAEIVFMQVGARLKVTVNQGGGQSMKGDVNGDGEVDVADISAVITVMAKGEKTPEADVNGDGEVDVADISAVITIMAGN